MGWSAWSRTSCKALSKRDLKGAALELIQAMQLCHLGFCLVSIPTGPAEGTLISYLGPPHSSTKQAQFAAFSRIRR